MPPDFILPDGYGYLAPDCERFFAEHPDYARNVFIMTRFEPGNRLGHCRHRNSIGGRCRPEPPMIGHCGEQRPPLKVR